MKLSDDLSAKWIYAKGAFFLIILIMSSVILMIEESKPLRFVTICTLVWSSARLYYFMFYVIEKYVDSAYRFSGVMSFIQYLMKKKD
ncbi:MAG: hypothetical protein ACPGN3_17955 [Opitutales bacterium]